MGLVDFSPRQRALFCVYTAVLIDMLGQALTLPTMPFYAQKLGATPAQLGTIFSTFAVTQVISQAWMGWAGDKIGRSTVLIFALVGPAFGFAASALAWDFYSLIAARAFLGLVSGCIATANAYVAEIVPPERRARLMAGLGAMTSMAFLFGPPIGSALAQFGLTAPFWVGCATSSAAAVVAYFNLLSPARLDELEKQSADTSNALFKRMTSSRLSLPAKGAGKAAPLLGTKTQAPAPAAAPPKKQAQWKMIALISLTAGFVTMSGSTMLTCTALFLERRLHWSELELGFVMMAQVRDLPPPPRLLPAFTFSLLLTLELGFVMIWRRVPSASACKWSSSQGARAASAPSGRPSLPRRASPSDSLASRCS